MPDSTIEELMKRAVKADRAAREQLDRDIRMTRAERRARGIKVNRAELEKFRQQLNENPVPWEI